VPWLKLLRRPRQQPTRQPTGRHRPPRPGRPQQGRVRVADRAGRRKSVAGEAGEEGWGRAMEIERGGWKEQQTPFSGQTRNRGWRRAAAHSCQNVEPDLSGRRKAAWRKLRMHGGTPGFHPGMGQAPDGSGAGLHSTAICWQSQGHPVPSRVAAGNGARETGRQIAPSRKGERQTTGLPQAVVLDQGIEKAPPPRPRWRHGVGSRGGAPRRAADACPSLMAAKSQKRLAHQASPRLTAWCSWAQQVAAGIKKASRFGGLAIWWWV